MICKQLLLLFFVACLFVPACIKCDDLLYDIFSSLHDFYIAKQIDRLVSCLVKHTICDYMIIIITLPRLKPMLAPSLHVMHQNQSQRGHQMTDTVRNRSETRISNFGIFSSTNIEIVH